MNLVEHHVKGDIKEVFDWMNFPLSPVKSAYYQKVRRPHPEWWIASFILGNNPVGLFKTHRVSSAAGTSIYVEEAIYKAIGEAAERYSSLNSHYIDDFVNMNVSDHGDFRFARCAWFEPCQDSFKLDGCKELSLEHTLVEQITTGKEFYVPAEHVHLGIARANQNYMHTSPISTGCAFYYDLETAIWKGMCEYVERDAMMRFWHLKRVPRRIDLSSKIDDFDLKTRLKRIRDANLKLHLFEISSAVNIPTVYAILEGKTFPYFCVGASANTDLIAACNKAIDEVISIRMMSIWNGFENYRDFDDKNFLWVDHLEAHMGLYANWKDCPAFDFFFDKSESVAFDDLLNADWMRKPTNAEELKANAQAIEDQGFTVLWKDITTPDIRKYGNVVKVVVPEMIPLSQNFSARWLDNLIDANSPDFDPAALNPYPHPFS